MILAGIFFALMNVSVKFIPHIPAIEIILFRSIFSLIFSYAFLRSQGVYVFGNNKKLLVIRGVVGSIGLITFFYTLQKIPLASAVTIQYLSPIFTTILGIFLVKERVRTIQFFYFGLAFIGVIVVQGFDPRVDLLYAGIGIISALFSGLAYNVIRKLKNTEHPLVIIFLFSSGDLTHCLGDCVIQLGESSGLGLADFALDRNLYPSSAILPDFGISKLKCV